MKIGIIGAMDAEIEAYRKNIKNLKVHKNKIFTFYTGKFHNHEIVLVKSGVGKVFASMICQHLIDKFGIKMVLFTGVGGSLNRSLKIGDVVVGKDSVHHDFDATALGFPRGNISYTDYRFFKADDKLVKSALKTKIDGHKIISGRILTGDQFMTQKEKRKNKYLVNELKGDCIEMEGAAVAQVCCINNIPHLIIRTVSDKANGTAVKDYNEFFPLVAENSFKIVDWIVKKL
jgi:adenosylhomocysteine nucleosidase